MCLGVPGRIVEIHHDEAGVRMGKVDFGGIKKDVCLAYLPNLAVGDYAIVHVGFAITQLDEESALQSLETFRQLGLFDEELGAKDPALASPPSCPVPDWTERPR